MGKVLCFGEILIRLSPSIQNNSFQQNNIDVYPGGAELNVASALAKWDMPVRYYTSVPDNFVAKQLVEAIKEKNIDTSSIHFGGERIGLYYLVQGSEIKDSTVVYDRSNSSFANLKKGMIDWDEVLNGVTWFHFSAICPAVSNDAAILCEEALQAASAKGITVSIDLNHRAKLWQYEKLPYEIMPQLMQYCDIVMGNIWAAQTMLSIPVDKAIEEIDTKENYLQLALITSKEIIKQFPKCKIVANTFRFERDMLSYYATLFSNDNLLISQEYKTQSVIDKVGTGDCFMAGLIYGFYHKLPQQEILDFATTAAFQKLFIKGDSTNKSVEEVKGFIKKHE